MPPKAKGKAKAVAKAGVKAGAKAKAARVRAAGRAPPAPAPRAMLPGPGAAPARAMVERLGRLRSLSYQISYLQKLVQGPGPLADQRLQDLQGMLADMSWIVGWQQRAQLLYHLRKFSPAPENAAAWQPVRDDAIARVEALRFPEISPDGAVLLELVTDGYGASVAAAIAMPKREWQEFKARVLALPDESISNEALGGRTSDECTTSHAMVNGFAEYEDPVRVAGFLNAFPDGAFGTPEVLGAFANLAQ